MSQQQQCQGLVREREELRERIRELETDREEMEKQAGELGQLKQVRCGTNRCFIPEDTEVLKWRWRQTFCWPKKKKWQKYNEMILYCTSSTIIMQ